MFFQEKIFCCWKYRLTWRRAPQPSDIYWENLDVKTSEKCKGTSITALVSLLILLISFVISMIFKELKQAILDKHGQNNPRPLPRVFEFILLLNAILVVIFNKILGFFITKLSCREKHETCSKFNISVSFKTTLALFINTAILPFLTYLQKKEWFMTGGLVTQIFYNTIAISLLEPLFSVFDLQFLVRKCRIFQERRKQMKSELTQQEANLLMQGNEFDFPFRTANSLLLFIMGLFYLPLLPLVIPITLVGSLITYWVDKILMLRRHRKPDPIGGEFSQFYMSIAPWILILYAFSNWYWVFRLSPRDQNPISAILVFLLLIAQLFPFRELLFMLMREKKDNQNEKQKIDGFQNEYQKANPIYQNEATLNFLQKKQEGEKEIIQNIFQSIMSYSKDHEPLLSKANSHYLFSQNTDQFFNILKKEEKSVGSVLEIVRQHTFINKLFKRPQLKATSSLPLAPIFSHLNLNTEQQELYQPQRLSSVSIEQDEKESEEKHEEQKEEDPHILGTLGALLGNSFKNPEEEKELVVQKSQEKPELNMFNILGQLAPAQTQELRQELGSDANEDKHDELQDDVEKQESQREEGSEDSESEIDRRYTIREDL